MEETNTNNVEATTEEVVVEVKKSKKKQEVEVDRIVFKDLEGKLIHIKVGDAHSPANDDDIEKIQNKMQKIVDEEDIKCRVLVTHHAVEIKIVEKNVKTA